MKSIPSKKTKKKNKNIPTPKKNKKLKNKKNPFFFKKFIKA